MTFPRKRVSLFGLTGGPWGNALPGNSPNQVTELLQQWSNGDSAAREKLVPLVYDELRRMARNVLSDRRDATLQSTALVHEAYLRLIRSEIPARNRAHFYAICAQLMRRILVVLAHYAREQVAAGADALQVFDSWVGCLSTSDYSRFVLPHTRTLIAELKATGVPVIYFGTDTTSLIPLIKQTRAEVVGVDWRILIDDAFEMLGENFAVQGNLDPVVLFAPEAEVRRQVREVLDRAAGRIGHIFNLGHGILPETPVENVIALVDEVHAYSASHHQAPRRSVAF